MRLQIRFSWRLLRKVAALFCLIGPVSSACSAVGTKLEVVSVRKLSAEEARSRSPGDVLGYDASARLRLSSGERALWFLVSDNPLVVEPRGYAVRMEGEKVIWRFGGPQGEPAAKSPGIERLSAERATRWIVLPSHSSIEWEVLDSSSQIPERRGFTVFVKEKEGASPQEIVSAPFDALIRTTEWP